MRSDPEQLAISTEKATEATRRYRARHPERVKEIRKRQYDTRKRRAMELVGGAKCCVCGCDEIDFLEFNHRNGGGCKEWRDKGSKPMVDKILTSKRRTDDLDIKCRLCNALDFLERKNKKSAERFEIKWN
jgi:hypothetical protein